MNFDPRSHPDWLVTQPWLHAKKTSPVCQPLTDLELSEIRARYNPAACGDVNAREAAVIWSLLDWIENAKGWTLP